MSQEKGTEVRSKGQERCCWDFCLVPREHPSVWHSAGDRLGPAMMTSGCHPERAGWRGRGAAEPRDGKPAREPTGETGLATGVQWEAGEGPAVILSKLVPGGPEWSEPPAQDSPLAGPDSLLAQARCPDVGWGSQAGKVPLASAPARSPLSGSPSTQVLPMPDQSWEPQLDLSPSLQFQLPGLSPIVPYLPSVLCMASLWAKHPVASCHLCPVCPYFELLVMPVTPHHHSQVAPRLLQEQG